MATKQTAVEWIVLQFGFQGRNNQEMLYVKQIVEQAKAMHKEQIIKFAMYLHNVDMSKTGTDILMDEAEQYYNETYGN
jgi:hypothetical protein